MAMLTSLRKDSVDVARDPHPSILCLILGLALLLVGYGGFIANLVIYHPDIVCILTGFIILCMYCWMRIKEQGLVRLLPLSLQRRVIRILHQPLFDSMYFNSGLTAYFREWARFFLLQMDLTEAEIKEVTKGMNREFLVSVLHKNMIEVLPPRLQTLLHPSRCPPQRMDCLNPDDLIIRDRPLMEFISVHPDAIQEALAKTKRPLPLGEYDWAVNVLREKKIQKERMAQHAPLQPVTQYLIRSRLQAPLITLQNTVFDIGAWWFNAGEWFSSLITVASLYAPAASLVAARGNFRDVKWQSHKFAGICLLASTSFSILAYQLRKRYPWITSRVQ